MVLYNMWLGLLTQESLDGGFIRWASLDWIKRRNKDVGNHWLDDTTNLAIKCVISLIEKSSGGPVDAFYRQNDKWIQVICLIRRSVASRIHSFRSRTSSSDTPPFLA
jgi:hypothetical protein